MRIFSLLLLIFPLAVFATHNVKTKRGLRHFSIHDSGYLSDLEFYRPTNRVYIVQKGDTTYSISARYGLPRGYLENANALGRTPLQPGQKLMIPYVLFYKIRLGDTVESVAYKFGVDLEALMKLNNLHSHNLLPGYHLAIPARTVGGKPESTLTLAETISLLEQQGGFTIASPSSGKKPYEASTYTPERNLQKTSSTTRPFVGWPTSPRGVVLQKYKNTTPLRRRGIYILAPRAVIYAVAPGRVAEVGHDPKNKELFVVLQNDDYSIMLYSGVWDIKVKMGQRLRAGAILGKTRRVLFFMVLQNGKTVDPRARLPK